MEDDDDYRLPPSLLEQQVDPDDVVEARPRSEAERMIDVLGADEDELFDVYQEALGDGIDLGTGVDLARNAYLLARMRNMSEDVYDEQRDLRDRVRDLEGQLEEHRRNPPAASGCGPSGVVVAAVAVYLVFEALSWGGCLPSARRADEARSMAEEAEGAADDATRRLRYLESRVDELEEHH